MGDRAPGAYSPEWNDMKILVVEDEKKIARAIRAGLEGENFEVQVAATGEDESPIHQIG